MEIDDIRERIRLIINSVGLNSVAFAEAIGIQQSTLSHILNGRNNPSLDVITKIHEKYKDISYSWLISGEGEMYLTSMPNSVQSSPVSFRSISGDNSPNLFDANAETLPHSSSDIIQQSINLPQDTNRASDSIEKKIIQQEIKYIEKPPRKIVEIRIFFDDNTYQIFTCDK